MGENFSFEFILLLGTRFLDILVSFIKRIKEPEFIEFS